MKNSTKWISLGLFALMGMYSTAFASGNVLAFQNDSCVAIHLHAEGNNACFGYGGCSFDIAPRATKQVSLRPGVRPKWAQVTVNGSCEAQKIVMSGQCAIDLEHVFRESGYIRNGAPGEGSTSGQRPIFEEITGPFDAGVTFATVKLNVGVCEHIDGVDHCDVRCTTK